MPRLFMLLLGCKPNGRHTEQHDVFFGIGESVKDLIPQIKKFWPEAKGKLHIDAWREVTHVGDFSISVAERSAGHVPDRTQQLFFINLGGYRPQLFDEPHFKVLTVQKDMAGAIQYAKTTSFFKEFSFPTANSHIDDKYGVDIDDLVLVGEILPEDQKAGYWLTVTEDNAAAEDVIHLGYFRLEKL